MRLATPVLFSSPPRQPLTARGATNFGEKVRTRPRQGGVDDSSGATQPEAEL